jgi:hypothetical protein
MNAMPEVIEQPLSYEQLAEKYRQLCGWRSTAGTAAWNERRSPST